MQNEKPLMYTIEFMVFAPLSDHGATQVQKKAKCYTQSIRIGLKINR
jgi:hypothetical protein